MPTFIDESGDAGTHPQSTPHFRMAAVWFETAEQADEFERQSVVLRARLNLRTDFEFHFTHLTSQLRRTFLEFALLFPFRYAFASTSKGVVRETLRKEVLISETVRGLTTILSDYYHIAEGCKPQARPDSPTPLNELVRYDECNDRVYQAVIEREFRLMPSLVKPATKLVRKVSPFRSQADPRLQLADMVCGAVGRHLDGESDLWRLIRGRELGLAELVWNGDGVVPGGTTPS